MADMIFPWLAHSLSWMLFLVPVLCPIEHSVNVQNKMFVCKLLLFVVASLFYCHFYTFLYRELTVSVPLKLHPYGTVIIIITQVVFIGICLLARILKKTTRAIFTKFGGKLAHGPRKKRLVFGGNRDHVALGLELGLRLAGGCMMHKTWHWVCRWGLVICRYTGFVSPGVCLTEKVLQNRQPWQRYALYWVSFFSHCYVIYFDLDTGIRGSMIGMITLPQGNL